ncbi:MAG TPA: ABC transporter permease [Saprospiraceae bacterium]|nr:ABC transporter permease [Saprospiraceae bacterium]HMQ82291.1 ABC transporter permease [Saprospiraceae bacterium]
MWVLYFKTAIRNFWRDKYFSGINLLGLSMGMAASLLIFQFVRYEWSYDRNSPHAAHIWRVYCETKADNGTLTLDANTHSAIGPQLKADLPEVVAFTRLYNRNEAEVNFIHEEKPIKIPGVWTADPGFLDLFPQEWLHGDKNTCLSAPYSVVITTSLANRLWDTDDAIGKTLEAPAGVFEGIYTVKGVVKDPLPNTHLKFNVLVSYATRYAKGHEDNWDNYWEYNYFQTTPEASVEKIKAKLAEYSSTHLAQIGLVLRLQAFQDIHLYSDLTYEIEANGNASVVNFLGIMACLILFIAYFNYVNLTTARALQRAKEVGIRKITGADRQQLIVQFLAEGALIHLLALILALAVLPFLLTWFGRYTDRPLALFFQLDTPLIGLVIGVFLSSLLFSGLYPAFILSAYRPSDVLKGAFFSNKSGQRLRKGLVTFQFTCSTLLIIAVIVVESQLSFLRRHDLGLNLAQVLAIKSPELDYRSDSTAFPRLQTFQEQVIQLNVASALALSDIAPGLGISSISGGSSALYRTDSPETKIQGAVYYIDISPSFFEVYDINILSGNVYTPQSREQLFQQVMINEAARALLGFPDAQSAVEATFAFDHNPNNPITIKGVVADFHIEGLQAPTRPTLYYINPRLFQGYISVKVPTEKTSSTIAQLESIWKALFPLSPFEYWFVDEAFARQYEQEQQLSRLFRLFALLAIFIACLGLLGLAIFSTRQRTKEIGIRKVLGASIAGIIGLLSRDFMRPVLLAILLATPLAWYLMHGWLDDFAYRIDIEWWYFALAGLGAVSIAFLTVGVQSMRAALANPVKSLRSE